MDDVLEVNADAGSALGAEHLILGPGVELVVHYPLTAALVPGDVLSRGVFQLWHSQVAPQSAHLDIYRNVSLSPSFLPALSTTLLSHHTRPRTITTRALTITTRDNRKEKNQVRQKASLDFFLGKGQVLLTDKQVSQPGTDRAIAVVDLVLGEIRRDGHAVLDIATMAATVVVAA